MKYRAINIYLTLTVLLALTIVGGNLPVARAQQSNRVGLVVVHGDGSTITRCVEFGESEISGYDVLTRSGLDIVASFDPSMGAAICAIDGEGCPADNCFCQCQGGSCVYWAYYHLVNGAWQYSQIGASGYKVHNGDVEGWSWRSDGPPPAIPFDQICAPLPTDTPPPTDTPLPPTDTPQPTNTPVPPTATLHPPTPMVWFRLDENPVPAGGCTTVHWDTSNVQEVYLDEKRVDINGSVEVCPTAPQEYHLRIVSTEGEQTHTLVLGMTGALPTSTSEPATPVSPSPAFTVQPTGDATPLPAIIPSPSPTPQPVAAVSPASPTPRPTDTPTSPPPTLTPRPVVSPQQSVSSEQQPTTAPPTNYVIFGLIAVGLAGLLIFVTLRQR